ncbi:hypothetical protein AVEN_149280-1 [Araneus ventricosus]|uniref:Uncharacterized protein n=1 Tax=Araneus ventricosus TaxID=182803 RepID=A0A4Y2KSC7_ARAVE|nr:hypothetical protein AVEN_149280-1 [Araneus ventricosus]
MTLNAATVNLELSHRGVDFLSQILAVCGPDRPDARRPGLNNRLIDPWPPRAGVAPVEDLERQGLLVGDAVPPPFEANFCILFMQRAIQLVDKYRSDENLRGLSLFISPSTAGHALTPCWRDRAESNATPGREMIRAPVQSGRIRTPRPHPFEI